jgi:hypothetical protein
MVKALLIGALPHAFEGPWVPLGRDRVWRYDPEIDFQNNIVLEYCTDTSRPVSVPLNAKPVEFEGSHARIVVPESFDHPQSFTVLVRRLHDG